MVPQPPHIHMGYAERREVYYMGCDNEGRKASSDPHHFIVVSEKDYNNMSDSILAIPITSKRNNIFVVRHGKELGIDDFDGPSYLAGSFVMCDRPCRVLASDVHSESFNPSKRTVIKFQTYQEIIKNVSTFMCPSLKFQP